MDIPFGQDRFLDLKFCILDDVFRACYQVYFVNHFYWTDALVDCRVKLCFLGVIFHPADFSTAWRSRPQSLGNSKPEFAW